MRTIALAMWLVAAAAAAQTGPAGDRYFQTADGVTLRYRVVGQARDTAIVLHGGPGLGLGSLAADLEPLAATVTLVLLDQRAAGRSSVPDTSALKLENYLSDIEALRQHLRLERISLSSATPGVVHWQASTPRVTPSACTGSCCSHRCMLAFNRGPSSRSNAPHGGLSFPVPSASLSS